MLDLIVFLGNPGREYHYTRHNAGWLVAAELEKQMDVVEWSTKWQAKVGAASLASQRVKILLPQAFVNRSGEAVRQAAQFFNISPATVLVVFDDLETPFGKIRLRRGGGTGGHNGLRSIASNLASADFWRLRIGIGRPLHDEVAHYVLANFTPDEKVVLPLILEGASEAVAELTTADHNAEAVLLDKWQDCTLVAD